MLLPCGLVGVILAAVDVIVAADCLMLRDMKAAEFALDGVGRVLLGGG